MLIELLSPLLKRVGESIASRVGALLQNPQVSLHRYLFAACAAVVVALVRLLYMIYWTSITMTEASSTSNAIGRSALWRGTADAALLLLIVLALYYLNNVRRVTASTILTIIALAAAGLIRVQSSELANSIGRTTALTQAHLLFQRAQDYAGDYGVSTSDKERHDRVVQFSAAVVAILVRLRELGIHDGDAATDQLLAGAQYLSGSSRDSVETWLQTLDTHEEARTRENIRSLRWALFGVAQSQGLEEAVRLMDEWKARYPSISLQRELSYLWLVVSPAILGLIEEDKLAAAQDISSEDRAAIQLIVDRFSDDYYADYGYFIIGDHKRIADDSPSSIVHDLALYRTAQESYQLNDFETASRYFRAFIEQYRPSRHRLLDDAAYRLMRSLHYLDRSDEAVLLGLEALRLPDGDMYPYIRNVTLAYLDTSFTSTELEELIARIERDQPDARLPLLKYTLAETWFAEGRSEDAKGMFQMIRDSYSFTREAELAIQNLDGLKDYFEYAHHSDRVSVVKQARFLIGDPSDSPDSTNRLVYYNDLFDGERLRSLKIIQGADGRYFESRNDYLRTVAILQSVLSREGQTTDVSEVYYLMALANYYLSLDGAFTQAAVYAPRRSAAVDAITFRDRLQYASAVEATTDLLISRYADSKYTPYAIELSALSYATLYAHTNDSRMFEKAYGMMKRIVELFPSHHLANNAAIYLARINAIRGSRSSDSKLRELYLDMARMDYDRVIRDFDSGHVGSEAKKELQQTLDLLSSISSNASE